MPLGTSEISSRWSWSIAIYWTTYERKNWGIRGNRYLQISAKKAIIHEKKLVIKRQHFILSSSSLLLLELHIVYLNLGDYYIVDRPGNRIGCAWCAFANLASSQIKFKSTKKNHLKCCLHSWVRLFGALFLFTSPPHVSSYPLSTLRSAPTVFFIRSSLDITTNKQNAYTQRAILISVSSVRTAIVSADISFLLWEMQECLWFA